jgi:hypothetical protein
MDCRLEEFRKESSISQDLAGQKANLKCYTYNSRLISKLLIKG